MPTLNEAAAESIELEQVGREIALLWPTFRGLYNLFEKSAKKVNIANVTQAAGGTRSAWRETMITQGASGISVGTGDGSSLGSGTGSQTASFAMAPIWAFNVTQYTRLAELATNGAERAVESFTKTEIKRSIKQFYNGIEGLMNGDGSGAFDQIPANAVITTGGSGNTTAVIQGIQCAAAFVDQQVVQIFPSEGGTARGNATISFVSVVEQKLNFSTALPGGTTQGDYIMVAGASGAVGSSILGDAAEELEKGVWYGKPDQLATIASQWYSTIITQNSEPKSESVFDRARAGIGKEFGERPFIYSNTAKAGRADLLFPENLSLGELCPVGLYDFGGGNTVMPVPDTSGVAGATYLTAKMFVYEWGGQVCNRIPRHGLFVTNASTMQI
jgi:hypothetical protein